MGFLLAAGVAAADGGFFSDSWSWVALASLFLVAVRLIAAPRVAFGRLDWLFLGGLLGLGGWTALSSLWAASPTGSLRETARLLAYIGAAALCLLVVKRRTVPALLASVLCGVSVVSGYALLTRVAPDRVGNWDPDAVYRLSDPVGYWNGLGIYAAMGALLAVGLAARARARTGRALAGAAPVLLLATVFFTFSRGAWIALGAGLVAAVALDPRRLQYLATLLALAPWPAVALLVAWRSDGLTDRGAGLDRAAQDGHAFLLLLVGLSLASGACAVAAGEIGSRHTFPQRARRAFALSLVVATALGLASLFAVYGSPWAVAERTWGSFTAPPRQTGGELPLRLFDLSSNGRTQLWQVALDEFAAHPVAGVGAGGFEAAWFRERPVAVFARDGHSLYLETLAELGIVGLVLLAAVLAAPVSAALRARRRPLVPVAFAPFAAFTVHAGGDWDWELAGVALVGIVLAVALVASARRTDEERALARPLRIGAAALACALAVVAVASVLANVPLARARAAYQSAEFARAAAEAERAADWAPWSSEALAWLGRAQLALGRPDDARATFSRALRRSPESWELWRDLAVAGGRDRAREPLRRALELNPLDPQLAQLLALVEGRPSNG